MGRTARNDARTGSEEDSMADESTEPTQVDAPQAEPDYKALYEAEAAAHAKAKEEARKWEGRSKANHDRVAELEPEAAKVADLTSRAEAAEAELERLRHERDVAAWKDRVAAETGVPAAALRGDTEEDLRAHAQAIRAAIPVYPQVPDSGAQGAKPLTKESILAVEDPAEREALIAANIDIF